MNAERWESPFHTAAILFKNDSRLQSPLDRISGYDAVLRERIDNYLEEFLDAIKSLQIYSTPNYDELRSILGNILEHEPTM